MDIKRGNIEIDNSRGKGQNVNVSMAKLKEHSLLKDNETALATRSSLKLNILWDLVVGKEDIDMLISPCTLASVCTPVSLTLGIDLFPSPSRQGHRLSDAAIQSRSTLTCL